MKSDHERFQELIKEFDTAMLCTLTKDNRIEARPMAIADVEETNDLWFITSSDTRKVDEIIADSRVQVVCQDERDKYLSIGGTARVVKDRAKIEELWKESYKTWFPDGKDDARIVLINVRPTDGEYWDNRGANKVKLLVEVVRAYATGQRARTENPDLHGRIQL
ncbi:MAG: pyridoxamine 5'-phosphate oxidase family protein [Gemmatimonadaceae bacterium]